VLCAAVDPGFIMHGPDGRDFKNRSGGTEITPPLCFSNSHESDPTCVMSGSFEALWEMSRLTMHLLFP
jgi:hypothetical protein